jgi:hypothetical protein
MTLLFPRATQPSSQVPGKSFGTIQAVGTFLQAPAQFNNREQVSVSLGLILLRFLDFFRIDR